MSDCTEFWSQFLLPEVPRYQLVDTDALVIDGMTNEAAYFDGEQWILVEHD